MTLRIPIGVVLLLCGLCGRQQAMAVQSSTLDIAQIQGAGWQAQQVQVELGLAEPIKALLKVERATLREVKQPLRQLVIECALVELEGQYVGCRKARISGQFPYLGKQRFTGSARYARSDGSIDVTLDEVSLAKGRARLQAQLARGQWQGEVNLHSADLGELLKLAQQLSLSIGVSGSGQLDARINAKGSQTKASRVEWQVAAEQLTLNNPAGTFATDKLAVRSTGSAQLTATGWQVDAQLQAPNGQGYVEPVFVDFTQHALNASLQAQWNGKTQLAIKHLHVQQQGVITASAEGLLQTDANNRVPLLNLHVAEVNLPGSFATYVQPFLLDSPLKNLSTGGMMRGEVQIANSAATQVDMQLQALQAQGDTLQFDDINGELHWRHALITPSAQRSTISWQRGKLFGIELGATTLPLELWADNARVADPTRIPIFNGALAIDAFRIRKLGTPQMAFMLDALIEPINVAQLSRAFGWPEFGGELGGKITKLRLQDGALTLGATLTAQIFAGEASISHMRMEGALSEFPRFNADIAFKQLNLEQVTQAFSFGRITGRLSGEINQLSLFNWQPVSFDARLYTPPDDRSKHRISQRAVQNIGSIGGSGGGVAAALQSGVLRFFDDFNYAKLGLSCRLLNDICLMNGIAPAKDGTYYLVVGRGLPRIDVIGTGTQVDWPHLVAQLKAATESSGPVVK